MGKPLLLGMMIPILFTAQGQLVPVYVGQTDPPPTDRLYDASTVLYVCHVRCRPWEQAVGCLFIQCSLPVKHDIARNKCSTNN